jgi:hypothetical protein
LLSSKRTKTGFGAGFKFSFGLRLEFWAALQKQVAHVSGVLGERTTGGWGGRTTMLLMKLTMAMTFFLVIVLIRGLRRPSHFSLSLSLSLCLSLFGGTEI